MNIEIKHFFSIKWISLAGQTSAGQTSPWYSLNGDKVLYLNIHLYMIWLLITYGWAHGSETARIFFRGRPIFPRVTPSTFFFTTASLWDETFFKAIVQEFLPPRKWIKKISAQKKSFVFSLCVTKKLEMVLELGRNNGNGNGPRQSEKLVVGSEWGRFFS